MIHFPLKDIQIVVIALVIFIGLFVWSYILERIKDRRRFQGLRDLQNQIQKD